MPCIAEPGIKANACSPLPAAFGAAGSAERPLRIGHTGKIKPVRRAHRAAGCAVARGKSTGHIFGRPGPGADPFQGADHAAHLIVQKRPGPHVKAELFPVRPCNILDIKGRQGADRVVRLTIRGPEGREIMPPDQLCGALPHEIAVKHLWNPPGKALVQREIRPATDESEHVLPLGGREPGMPVVRNPCHGQNRDGQGTQMVVQRLREAKRIPVTAQVTMRDLPGGMHARVGTPRSHDLMRSRGNPVEGGFNGGLNRRLGRLALPARKGAAVVFDLQRIAGHSHAANDDGGRNQSLHICSDEAYLCDGPEQGTKSVVIASVADGLTRGMDSLTDAIISPFSDRVIRLGVTGLSRAGKTVFITSLVANLMDRGRMPQLVAAANGSIRTAWLQPQPDDTVPRFDYESHLARLTALNPTWPEGTRQISELRLSLRIQPTGFMGGLTGLRTVHLDIVDYPGEWLLDLGLLDKSYADWSSETLARLDQRPGAAGFLAALSDADPAAPMSEPGLIALASSFTDYLHVARDAGFSDCSPGRFLLPGDLKGSPVLTFAPMRRPDHAPRGSYWTECERRFESYKRNVVKPFFRDHFSRIDRQIVLVDVLGAIHAGPRAVDDLRTAMADILGAFRPGRNPWLARIVRGRRVERILFAATKADHLHHSQHPKLTAITEALLREAKDRADFAGARTAAMSIASLRTTVEDTVTHEGQSLDVVRGRLLDGGRQAAFYPGALPADPQHLLSPAREGAPAWLEADYKVMNFAPSRLTLKPGDGPPHIRLDKAAEFLIGDRL
jgi:predicted YcjX-like family ATPase